LLTTHIKMILGIIYKRDTRVCPLI